MTKKEAVDFYSTKNIQWFLSEYYINKDTFSDYVKVVKECRDYNYENHSDMHLVVYYNGEVDMSTTLYTYYTAITKFGPNASINNYSPESLYDPEKNIICDLSQLPMTYSVFAPRIQITPDILYGIEGFIVMHVLMTYYDKKTLPDICKTLHKKMKGGKSFKEPLQIIKGIIERSQAWIQETKIYSSFSKLEDISNTYTFAPRAIFAAKESTTFVKEGEKKPKPLPSDAKIIFFQEDLPASKVLFYDTVIDTTYSTLKDRVERIKQFEKEVEDLKESMMWLYQHLPDLLKIPSEDIEKYSKL